MQLHKIADLTFRNENIGYHHGQSDNRLIAHKDDEYVGGIKYSVFDGEVKVHMIIVPLDKRRKGYGTALLLHLQSMFPGTEINLSGLTDKGAKLYKALPKHIKVDQEIDAKFKRLRQAKARIAAYQKRADAIYGKSSPTDKDRTWFQTVSDRWNALHDEVSELEQELRGRSSKKRFFGTASTDHD